MLFFDRSRHAQAALLNPGSSPEPKFSYVSNRTDGTRPVVHHGLTLSALLAITLCLRAKDADISFQLPTVFQLKRSVRKYCVWKSFSGRGSGIFQKEFQMLGKIAAVAAVAAGGMMISKQFRKTRNAEKTTIEESIEVNVPVSTAYNQWTQFEEFPKFMKGVCEVSQVDDTHLHWRAKIGRKEEEWDAEITEQIPDQRIAWHSTGGAENAGVLTFHKISDSTTRIMLQMDYGPKGFMEGLGDALGAVKIRTRGDLKRFKKFIEDRGSETGAWRGSVAHH